MDLVTMLGKLTAELAPRPRRWLLRLWGYPDINTRQKWSQVWPELSKMPLHDNTRLLDAGCGNGIWSLEIAARRLGWDLVGVDIDANAIASAKTSKSELGLRNLQLLNADFLEYSPQKKFDVVLSILSAHYLAKEGFDGQLFSQFRSWLRPGGMLILLGPRKVEEVPFLSWLPHQKWHHVFSKERLQDLCLSNSLRIHTLRGSVGKMGTIAKQLSLWATDKNSLVRIMSYAVEWMLSRFDVALSRSNDRKSLMWLLVAFAQ